MGTLREAGHLICQPRCLFIIFLLLHTILMTTWVVSHPYFFCGKNVCMTLNYGFDLYQMSRGADTLFLFDRVDRSFPQGYLLYLLIGIMFRICGPRLGVVSCVGPLFSLWLFLGIYVLGSRLRRPWIGVMACLFCYSVPEIRTAFRGPGIDLPAAALAVWALTAFLFSRNFTVLLPSAMLGILLGLGLMIRSVFPYFVIFPMAIFFLQGRKAPVRGGRKTRVLCVLFLSVLMLMITIPVLSHSVGSQFRWVTRHLICENPAPWRFQYATIQARFIRLARRSGFIAAMIAPFFSILALLRERRRSLPFLVWFLSAIFPFLFVFSPEYPRVFLYMYVPLLLLTAIGISSCHPPRLVVPITAVLCFLSFLPQCVELISIQSPDYKGDHTLLQSFVVGEAKPPYGVFLYQYDEQAFRFRRMVRHFGFNSRVLAREPASNVPLLLIRLQNPDSTVTFPGIAHDRTYAFYRTILWEYESGNCVVPILWEGSRAFKLLDVRLCSFASTAYNYDLQTIRRWIGEYVVLGEDDE